jgi:flagellar basal-body rod protein FlgC
MFDMLDMGASGLTAQRIRMDTIANNIANINTTRNAAGQPIPYRRRFVLFEPGQATDASKPGVHVQDIKQDDAPFARRFLPGHPDADKDGYVLFPNIDLATEHVNALEASRAYDANITMIETAKAMFNASLRLIA